jgi:hypothetical protein
MGEMQRMTVQRSAQTLAPQRRADVGRARTASPTTLIATPTVQSASFSVLQPKLMVGAANDPFEREADRTADEVMSAGSAPRIGGGGIAASLMRWVRRAVGKVEPIAKKDEPPVKKDEEDKKKLVQKDSIGTGPATVPAGIEASIDAMSAGGGSPLAPALREQFEPRFGYDFSDVRVHTGPAAAGAAHALGARAFTVGRDVFFGAGEYQPASAQGQRLVAHELTHTIQQAPAATRASRALSTALAPVRAAPKRIQRLFDDTKAAIRNKVRDFITRDFPPWDLITLIIGWDPIQEKSVKGSTRDWIRAAMKLAPDGEALFARLDQEGKIDSVAKWWDAEIAKLDLSYAGIVALANKAWESVGASDIFSPAAAWNEKIKPIFMPTITRVWEFIKAVGAKILSVVKDLVLGSISAWAQTQRGYTLLTFVLGKDPVTGQEVKRTVKGLIFAVLDLVPGGEPIKENLEKSKTIEKASAWFSQEVKTLDLTWEGIKALFKQAWDAFKVSDLLNPKLLFEKMAAIFGPPLLRLLNFLLAVGKKVLEFIFEGAMMLAGPIGQQIAGIFRKIGETFNKIVADPVAFVGYLVSAVKKGIQQFAKNILDHLKTGLIEWLVGTLDGAGLVLPKVWDLKGILDLVLQILGITYAKIRVKLVKVLGEKTVSMLETAFAFLKTLVTEGPAAAWKQIVEAIGSLWDMVIGGIKDWAITKIVTAAITKLVTMFNPAGAIIQAIIATYNTVAFFIERIKQILAFVEAVVDSIANIASGKIAQAANYVERAMGRTIPVILGFLARLIGLGNVSEAVKKVITAIQAKVDKGIDAVIKWVVDKAKSLFGGKTADAKGPAPADSELGPLPQTTFPEDDLTHTVSFRKEGGKWKGVVSSATVPIAEFIAAAKKADGISDKAKDTYIPLAEKAAAKMATLEAELEAAPAADKETKRKALADAEVELAEALKKLLAGVDIKKFDEKYKLEGLVATYASTPRQTGDILTPDHQPQASLLKYAANAEDQDRRLVFAGTRIRGVIGGHVDGGVTINLHHERHKLGSTYGRSPPAGTLASIDKEARSSKSKPAKQTAILSLLDVQLGVDVAKMKSVAASDTNYPDIVKFTGSTKKAKPLIEKIRGQINAGGDRIRAQNLQSLKDS